MRSLRRILSTGGSKANIQLLADQRASLAIVQNDVMSYAYSGTDLFFSEGSFDKFSAVAGLYDETIQIVTCREDLHSVEDLKGLRVCVGDAGSGVEFNARQILSAYGLKISDIQKVNVCTNCLAGSLPSRMLWQRGSRSFPGFRFPMRLRGSAFRFIPGRPDSTVSRAQRASEAVQTEARVVLKVGVCPAGYGGCGSNCFVPAGETKFADIS